MANTDISIFQRLQIDPPRPLHKERYRRTLEEDLEYHPKAHRAFRQLAESIEVAEKILAKFGTGHFGSKRALQLRRLLFEAEIADARKLLERLSDCDDICRVWGDADNQRHYLAAAVCEYLDLVGLWSFDQIKAWVESRS
jgi:hypothetical protein